MKKHQDDADVTIVDVTRSNGHRTLKTTRKTIEVPEDYFFQVKMRAFQRHMKEKELWAEIVAEYFENHPQN